MEKSLGLYILRNILTRYPLPNGRPFDVHLRTQEAIYVSKFSC